VAVFDSLELVELLVSLVVDGFDSELDSVLDDAPSEVEDVELLVPLVDEAVELAERESVMYQPLPLNTMPTGWMTLRSAPPHCSHVVRGESEKLWRFSMTSLHAVQV
jgi:hypothetical protein